MSGLELLGVCAFITVVAGTFAYRDISIRGRHRGAAKVVEAAKYVAFFYLFFGTFFGTLALMTYVGGKFGEIYELILGGGIGFVFGVITSNNWDLNSEEEVTIGVKVFLGCVFSFYAVFVLMISGVR